MKKSIKFLIFAIVLTIMLAVMAFAESVTYTMVPIDEEAGLYDLIINAKCTGEGKVLQLTTQFTFNNEILRPANRYADYTEVPLETVTYQPIATATNASGGLKYNLQDNKWTTEASSTSLLVTAYISPEMVDQFDATDLDVLTISFVLVDGKKITDIKESDFVIDKILLQTGANGEFGYNEPTIPTELPFENNVPTKTEALTIPVTTGDVIYFQDGTSAVAKTTGDYEIPADDGYVTVNTGYDSQKVYLVESGVVSEQTDLRDGVLGTNASAIRNDRVASGIRFKSSFLTVLKSSVKEYGYLVTVESDYNALPEDYELNMALVEARKAKKGVAYSEADGIDISNGTEAERIVVTMVTTGVPLTKEAVQTNIVARPYYILGNGAVIYGEPATRQVIEVALAIRDEGGAAYNENKAYIDKIISLVSEEELEVIIPLGPLF